MSRVQRDLMYKQTFPIVHITDGTEIVKDELFVNAIANTIAAGALSML